MAYLILFERDDPEITDQVLLAIKALGDWAIVTSHSMLLDTTHDVRTIMQTLQPVMMGGQLWVFTCSAPWGGAGDPLVDEFSETLLGPDDDWVPLNPGEVEGRP